MHHRIVTQRIKSGADVPPDVFQHWLLSTEPDEMRGALAGQLKANMKKVRSAIETIVAKEDAHERAAHRRTMQELEADAQSLAAILSEQE